MFSKVKERLGGRVRLIVTGGAPLARHVEDFLKVCMCCPVIQGYGLTETCAASFIATPDVAVSPHCRGILAWPLEHLTCRIPVILLT